VLSIVKAQKGEIWSFENDHDTFKTELREEL